MESEEFLKFEEFAAFWGVEVGVVGEVDEFDGA